MSASRESPAKESAVAGTARRPNIVFILADDMGFGDFSRFNGGISRTPVLDSLMGPSSTNCW